MRKVIYWEVENEGDYNTWELEHSSGHGDYDDYCRLVYETSVRVRERIPGVKVLAGGLRGYSLSDMAYYLAQHPSAQHVDLFTVHHGERANIKRSMESLSAAGVPKRTILNGEAWAKDTRKPDLVLALKKALLYAIENGGGAAVLAIYSSIRKWGNPPKDFTLGVWGDNYHSPFMEQMITEVSAVARSKGQMLAAMWGEEYADGNEHAAEFAREFAPVCRLGISTEAFDPMLDGRGWGVEKCLEEYPAMFTMNQVSCLQVIQRAKYLWVALDGSEHDDPSGRYYHRMHLGYDPSLPPEDQEWAECLAPYYHSQRVTGNIRRIQRELAEYLGDLMVEDPPLPPPDEDEEVMNEKETKAVRKLVREALGGAHEVDDLVDSQPEQGILRREVKAPLRKARKILNEALRDGE